MTSLIDSGMCPFQPSVFSLVGYGDFSVVKEEKPERLN